MEKEERKEAQLRNLLDKPVYFLQCFKYGVYPDGTGYTTKERKFLPGMTFARALEEARKEQMRGFYDDVKLYRMRRVVDSVPIWGTENS